MALRGLDGKVALVTGGGAGIGAATARRLAEEGMKVVVVVDLDGDAAERMAAELAGETLAVSADVSSDDDVTGFVTAAVDRFGRIDAALLNAGVGGDGEVARSAMKSGIPLGRCPGPGPQEEELA